MAAARRGTGSPLLGPLESAVMAEVWRHSTTVDEVTATINATRRNPLSRKTVLTILTRLEAKGLLTHTREGKAYRFSAALTEAAFVAREATRAAERLIGTFGELGISGFVEQVSLDPDRLARLEELLEDRREGD